jgi:hypothetical protein
MEFEWLHREILWREILLRIFFQPFKSTSSLLTVVPTGDLPQHLQVMINLLRCEDRIKLVRSSECTLSFLMVTVGGGRCD